MKIKFLNNIYIIYIFSNYNCKIENKLMLTAQTEVARKLFENFAQYFHTNAYNVRKIWHVIFFTWLTILNTIQRINCNLKRLQREGDVRGKVTQRVGPLAPLSMPLILMTWCKLSPQLLPPANMTPNAPASSQKHCTVTCGSWPTAVPVSQWSLM